MSLRKEIIRLAYTQPNLRDTLLPLVFASDREATEFPSQEALAKYLHEHPDADKSKHSVKKNQGIPHVTHPYMWDWTGLEKKELATMEKELSDGSPEEISKKALGYYRKLMRNLDKNYPSRSKWPSKVKELLSHVDKLAQPERDSAAADSARSNPVGPNNTWTNTHPHAKK